VVNEQSDLPHLCDVGGCEFEGEFTFLQKYTICPGHLIKHVEDEIDLNVYFHIFESKVLGVKTSKELEEYDPDELDAFLDFVDDSVNEELGEKGSVG
jgi:hypothetical protein